MAIRSGFFNSVAGDRVYSASEFAEYFAAFIGSGVFPEPSTSLKIEATTGLTLKIKAGKAWINGYFLINDADFTEVIPVDAVLNRIDRYVIRLHFASRQISILRKEGIAASSPVAPSVTRDAESIELSLALVQVNAGTSSITSGNITDTRADASVCGFVSSTITNLPNMTANRALISDTAGKLEVSNVTSSELGMLSGVTSALQTQLNAKQATVGGAASTIVSSNLSFNKVLISDGNGKVIAAIVTVTELGTLAGVTSAIQTQLNAKQATINGPASTITSGSLPANRVLLTDGNGKVANSEVTTTELEFLAGVTSSLQTQLNAKLGSSAQAADALKVGGKKITVGTIAPGSPVIGDVWIDTN
ncbi:MAG: hypothetical protein A2Y19_00575 [Firmicutes bacterium GWE2_51_13]|nr:MAG: hypothetical protein A2Y19_00575 [Firmicutes bacterium GWE2_51_13]